MSRRLAVVCATVLLLVLGGTWLQRRLLGPTELTGAVPAGSLPPLQPSGVDPDAPGPTIRVTRLEGTVERQGADGSWSPVRQGEILHADDVIRTGTDATAEIELGSDVALTVARDTTVALGQVSQTLSRVRLDDGRLATVVRGGKDFRFRVEVRASDAVAESEAGEFDVVRRGSGPVGVAARSGSVELTSRGERVRVGEGEQSFAYPGEAPTPPETIPPALFLKLGRPPPELLHENEATIEGRTAPGAVVTIDGRPGPVAPDGSFTRSVRLKTGANEIVVEVEDLLGRRAQERVPKITVVPAGSSTGPSPAGPDAGLSGRVVW
jgi:hypothetical protein